MHAGEAHGLVLQLAQQRPVVVLQEVEELGLGVGVGGGGVGGVEFALPLGQVPGQRLQGTGERVTLTMRGLNR